MLMLWVDWQELGFMAFPRNFVCQGCYKITITLERKEDENIGQAYTQMFKELAVKRVWDG